MKRPERSFLLRHLACLCGVIGLLGMLCLYHQHAQPVLAQDASTPTTPAVSPSSDASGDNVSRLASVDDDVEVTGSDLSIDFRLAQCESDIGGGYRVLGRGRTEDAHRLFASAFARLRTLRSEYGGIQREPMVRLNNLARGRFDSRALAETWRPFLDYFNAWVARLPESFQDQLADFDRVHADSALRLAIEQGNELALRNLTRSYCFTEAGTRAAEMLAYAALERGDHHGVAAQLLSLRELRPRVFQKRPALALGLLVALEAVGERELRSELEAAMRPEFERGQVMVGEEQLGFSQALEQMRRALGFRVSTSNVASRQSVVGARLSDPIVLPLSLAEVSHNQTPSSMGYYGAERARRAQLFFEPRFWKDGVITARPTPAGESVLVWYPAFDPTHRRWLATSAADVYVPVKDEPRSGRFRWNDGGGAREPDTHVIGTAIGEQTARKGDQKRTILASILACGSSQGGRFTGNRIQLFDLSREGALLYSLPNMEEVGASRFGDVVAPATTEAAGSDGDASSGRKAPQALLDTATAEALSRTTFGGAPLLLGDRLYVLGSISAASSSEMHLYCFDIGMDTKRPGGLLWRKKIGAVTRDLDALAWQMSSPDVLEGSTIINRGQLLLVSTNAGSACAVDARDGHRYWQVKYRIRQGEDRQWWGWRQYRSLGFSMMPSPMASEGMTAIVAPVDGRAGISLNMWDGVVLKPLLDTRRNYEQCRYFLGLRGGYAYFQTDQLLQAQAATFSGEILGADGEVRYGASLAASGIGPELREDLALRVRGLLLDDEVLLAGKRGLHRFNRFTLAYSGMLAWPDVPASQASDPAAKGREHGEALKGGEALPGGMLEFLAQGKGPGGRAAVVLVSTTGVRIYPLAEN